MTFQAWKTRLNTVSYSSLQMQYDLCDEMWNVGNVVCQRSDILSMWDVGDVGMLRMWNIGDLGSSGCGMLEIWDAQDVGRWGCGIFEMWDVEGVGCSGCVMFEIWNIQDVWGVGCTGPGVGCGMFARMWDVDLQNAQKINTISNHDFARLDKFNKLENLL